MAKEEIELTITTMSGIKLERSVNEGGCRRFFVNDKEVNYWYFQYKQNIEYIRIIPIPSDNTINTDKNIKVVDWIHTVNISCRLYNVLKSKFHDDEVQFLDKKMFMSARNAGEKTWQEFVRLRGLE